MRKRLSSLRKSPLSTSYVVMVKDGAQLLSWALVFPLSGPIPYGVYYYTRESARRQGYASIVHHAVTAKFGRKLKTFPWGDDANPSKHFLKGK